MPKGHTITHSKSASSSRRRSSSGHHDRVSKHVSGCGHGGGSFVSRVFGSIRHNAPGTKHHSASDAKTAAKLDLYRNYQGTHSSDALTPAQRQQLERRPSYRIGIAKETGNEWYSEKIREWERKEAQRRMEKARRREKGKEGRGASADTGTRSGSGSGATATMASAPKTSGTDPGSTPSRRIVRHQGDNPSSGHSRNFSHASQSPKYNGKQNWEEVVISYKRSVAGPLSDSTAASPNNEHLNRPAKEQDANQGSPIPVSKSRLPDATHGDRQGGRDDDGFAPSTSAPSHKPNQHRQRDQIHTQHVAAPNSPRSKHRRTPASAGLKHTRSIAKRTAEHSARMRAAAASSTSTSSSNKTSKSSRHSPTAVKKKVPSPRDPYVSVYVDSPGSLPDLMRYSGVDTSPDFDRNYSPQTPIDSQFDAAPLPSKSRHEIAPNCPIPDCKRMLLTALDRQNNLCEVCRKDLQPRASTFWSPVEEKQPIIDEEALELLRALPQPQSVPQAAIPAPWSKDSDHETIHRIEASPQTKLASRFNTADFKLQPAPLGRRPTQRSQKRQMSTGSLYEPMSARTTSSSGSSHIGFQLAGWQTERAQTPDPEHSPAFILAPTVFNPQELATKLKPATIVKERSDRGRPGTRRASSQPPAKPAPPMRVAELRYRESGRSDPGGEKKPSFRISAVRSSSAHAGLTRPGLASQANSSCSRLVSTYEGEYGDETDIYREIEEIIDCYLQIEEHDDEDGERRKAEVVASYFEVDPEAVKMMKLGFF
ncbi:hypothetical protein F5Y15DRAFT_413379 [Xylariaceae sp. FL0016]|nr:hypothetical protein F5Y15DRAFT_413379 [Xylariaceae sp. FL0016]